MAKATYLTDPVVAAAYHVAPGEFASVNDDEADWLVANHHGYPIDGTRAMPAAGFVHPDAPLPFVPYAGGEAPPEGSQPAGMTFAITNPAAGSFDVVFNASVRDSVDATGHFVVADDAGATLADVTYTQPPGTTATGAAGKLHEALLPYSPPLVLGQITNGLNVEGGNPPVVGAVAGELTVPVVAPPPAARRGILRRRTP